MNNDSVEVLKGYFNGTKYWWLNDGTFHRTDGPAVESEHGTKEWYLNGERHRKDGPAIERYNGDREWYLNGKRHRTDGPAIERANGTKEWWLNGEEIDEFIFWFTTLERQAAHEE